jgi:hypothetical protein
MNLTTVNVAIAVALIVGTPVPGGSVRFALTRADVNGAIVALQPFTVSLPTDGSATSVKLWPNVLGTQGSQYQVTVYDQAGVQLFSGTATIPSSDCNLHDVLNLLSPPTVTDAQAAVDLAREWAQQTGSDVPGQAAGSRSAKSWAGEDLTPTGANLGGSSKDWAISTQLPDGVNKSAKSSALAAAGSATAADVSRQQADADKTQTGLDRIQTGIDRAQADADLVSVNTLTLTAQAQAALAISAAASASSAVQQDLSGTAGQALALHRSPGGIVGTVLGDCRQDSNGGAWRKQMQGTSWYQEALQGNWLGWQVSEACARAVNGTLGPESITGADPGFGSATGWTTGTGASVSGGLLNLASVANGVGATTTGTASVIGTVYKVTCKQSITSGGVRVSYGGKSFDFYGSGSEPIYLQATSASTAVSVVAIGTTTGSVDVVSIKPVTANVTNTGDFYGDSTVGKFYSLSAGSGTTETFTGNSADFPEQYAGAAEASSLLIFDAGTRAMWKRFVANVANNAIPGTITSVAYTQGAIWVGTSAGVVQIDFAGDRIYKWTTAGRSRYLGRVADANSGLGWVLEDATKTIPSNTVNAVAACVMPDAPADQLTWLQVPTIQLLTAGGVSLIQNDGNVRNSVLTTAFTHGCITPYYMLAGNLAAAQWYYALKPGQLGAAFTLQAPTQAASSGFFTGLANRSMVPMGARGMFAARYDSALAIMRFNESNSGAGITALIGPYSNTGGMFGDIRRVLLADAVAGTINDAELTINGNFATNTDWTGLNGGTVNISGGVMSITNGSAAFGRAANDGSFPVVAGQVYEYTLTVAPGSGSTAVVTLVAPAGSPAFSNPSAAVAVGTTGHGFVLATGSGTAVLQVGSTSSTQGVVTQVSSVSLKQAVADRSYKGGNNSMHGALARALLGGVSMYSGWSAANYVQEAYSTDYDPGTGGFTVSVWGTIPVAVAAAGWAFDRSAAAGPFYQVGHDATGHIVATVSDGTTTRTVTTATAYNTGLPAKVRLQYETSGTLTIKVNGETAATATGTPLLTMTNATAVATTGIDRGLTAPWAGSLSLVKVGMTVPTDDAGRWMYAQELAMFAAGAQITLPDSGAVVDVDYDPQENCIKVVSAANESKFVGLCRVSTAPASAGSFTKVAHRGGIKLLARSTTNPGVDIVVPPLNLREEVYRKGAEAAAAASKFRAELDWDGSFTATTTLNSALLTSVANLTIPPGASLRNVRVSGAGIPASTTILGFSGTTIQLSAPCTAAASGVTVTMQDVVLPTGIEAEAFSIVGAKAREGASKTYTRSFDGFREMLSQVVAPGNTGWLNATGRRML